MLGSYAHSPRVHLSYKSHRRDLDLLLLRDMLCMIERISWKLSSKTRGLIGVASCQSTSLRRAFTTSVRDGLNVSAVRLEGWGMHLYVSDFSTDQELAEQTQHRTPNTNTQHFVLVSCNKVWGFNPYHVLQGRTPKLSLVRLGAGSIPKHGYPMCWVCFPLFILISWHANLMCL